ncbi:MAG: Ammonium transporter, partial [uncultured Corynebacteriales bacterium]
GLRHGDGGHGRHRLGPHQCRTGPADDPRPGVLLRRDGAGEERHGDAGAELPHHRRRRPGLGARRLLPRLRAGGRARRAALRRAAEHDRRGARLHRRRRPDDPAAGLRGLPDDVRGDHPGDHHRLHRGPDAVRRARPVRRALVPAGVRPRRALDLLPGRLGRPPRRAGLRRRHRRARQRGRRRTGHGAGAGSPTRLAGRADATAQPAVRPARHRPALGRLARVQRRLGAGRRPGRRVRVRQHRARLRGGHAHLERGRAVPVRQADDARRGLRRGRRPGRGHPVRRLRQPARRDAGRRGRRGPLRAGGRGQDLAAVRRLPRRRRGAPRRRRGRVGVGGPAGHPRGQPAGRRRPVLRRRLRPARRAAAGRADRGGLLLRRDVPARPGHRPDGGGAGVRRGRGGRAGPGRARRDRVRVRRLRDRAGPAGHRPRVPAGGGAAHWL